MRIGVISDTHNFLDPRVPGLFASVDHILHAGDIGRHTLIVALEQIAPVTAVVGNNDDLSVFHRETEVVELSGRRFFLRHVLRPHEPGEAMQQLIAKVRPGVVVFGHTHKPFSETIHGTLYLNPGYAGKPRFGLERSVAVVECNHAGVQVQFLPL